MKLDQIRYFVTTAETQHIGKAAKRLHISPSAISHSLRALEEELGQALFEKSGKNIYLTEFGQKFSQRAPRLLEHADQLMMEFRSTDLPLEGSFRWGASHGLSNHIVAKFCAQFQKKNPKVQFEIYSLRSAEVVQQVAQGTLDLGLCFSPTAHPHIQEICTIPQKLQVAFKSNHPIFKKKKVYLKQDLSQLPAASPKAFAGIEVCENHPILAEKGVETNNAFIFDSYEVVGEYLKSSQAWCLIPEFMVKAMKLKSLPGIEAPVQISLICPKSRPIPQSVKDNIQEYLKNI